MNHFTALLARRLLQIAALGVPATQLTACGPNCGDTTIPPVQICLDPAMLASTGAAGGSGGAPGTGGAGGAPGAGGATGTGGAKGTGGAGGAATCPAGDAASIAISNADPSQAGSVQSGPTWSADQCCYVVQPYSFCSGRPFLVDDAMLAAPPRPGALGWSDPAALLPDVADLAPSERAALAEAWTRDGLLEHASVASFGRFALELLAVGAPAELVELAHHAALDEVRHARLCFGLAGAYAGTPVRPGAFPFAGQVEVSANLASVAARAAREGCVGETIAAVQAAEQRTRATNPAVRAALAVIAEDEARHAELAWRAVVWALGEGGEPVRAAVLAVLGDLGGGECEVVPRGEGALDRHGRLDAEEQGRVAVRVLAEVVRPAARALLEERVMA